MKKTFNFEFGRHPLVAYQNSASLILETDMKKKTLFLDLVDNLKIFPFPPSIVLFKNSLLIWLILRELQKRD